MPRSSASTSMFSRTQQLRQNMGPAMSQVFETPEVKSQPKQNAVTTSTLTTPPKNRKGFSRNTLGSIVVGIVLLLLIVGGGIAMYLASQPQDTRQQASVEGGTARLSISPATSSFTGGQQASIVIQFNMGANDVPIDGIQFVAEFKGTVPEDMQFTPATVSGLNPVGNTFTDISGGKKLSFAFLSQPPSPFLARNVDLTIGTLTFTAPSAGELTVEFDPVSSKVVKNQTGDDLLKTPTSIGRYTFTSPSGAIQTATPSGMLYTANLVGTNEVPSVVTTASGSAELVYDTTSRKFDLDIGITGISLNTITSTRLYSGSATQNGQVILDLGSRWSTESGQLIMSATDQTFSTASATLLTQGNVYLNISTQAHPNGEIRGQLIADNGIGGVATSPTPTPSATPSTTTTSTPTPTPTSVATSSGLTAQPTQTQAQPVTGALENTILMILIGIAMISGGLYFVRNGT